MNRFPRALLALSALAAAMPLAAQTTAPTTPPAPATPPATPAPATSASVTDAEVSSFATAAIAVGKVQKDATIADADKQRQMVAAIEGAGLTPARFNEIATLFQADAAFKARVQAAAPPAATATPAQPQQ